MMMEFITS